jgi:glycosyltransferase involved in cell wall biosynthesis
MGGAETVHLDILKVFENKKNVCLITNESVNDHNKKKFENFIKIIEINKLIKKRKLKMLALKLISRKINSNPKAIVFGCNSHFFYDIIPYLKSHVKIIDLIHAFSYEEPYAAEKYSIPHVNRINKRVVLGKKTVSDFEKLYLENNISPTQIEKINIIKNKVSIPIEQPKKQFNDSLKILFVGRNSYEKRASIFFEIAKECQLKNLNTSFIVIGNFDKKTIEAPLNTKIIGEINDTVALNEYYQSSDLLLITSSREGFPMVVLEGMAFGVVPICTNVGEISEFINTTNNNGIIIENYTDTNLIISEFIKHIKIIEEDRNLLSKMSNNAFVTLKENFNLAEFNKNYIELLNS